MQLLWSELDAFASQWGCSSEMVSGVIYVLNLGVAPEQDHWDRRSQAAQL